MSDTPQQQRGRSTSSSSARSRSPKSSSVLKKYARQSPSRIDKATASALRREQNKAMLKLVDDAIENGPTDEALARRSKQQHQQHQQQHQQQNLDTNWKTFEQHVEDAAVAAERKKLEKKKLKKEKKKNKKKNNNNSNNSNNGPIIAMTEEELKKSKHREEAKRLVAEAMRKRRKDRGEEEDESNNNSSDDEEEERKNEKERLAREEEEEREKERERLAREERERLAREQLALEREKLKQLEQERDERRRNKEKERRDKEQALTDRRERKKAVERVAKQKEALAERLALRRKEDPSFVERVPKRSAILVGLGLGTANNNNANNNTAAAAAAAYERHKEELANTARKEWHQPGNADKWSLPKGQTFDGGFACEKVNEEDRTVDSLQNAIDDFEAHPEKYVALYYPTTSARAATSARATPPTTTTTPLPLIKVTFVLREGTTLFRPKNVRSDGTGTFCLHQHLYERLKPFPFDRMPENDPNRDKHTDTMEFEGSKLHSESRLPLLPGRGMGLADAPHTKLLGGGGGGGGGRGGGNTTTTTNNNNNNNNNGNGNGVVVVAEPNDVVQGTVGDCWLLSAIACLADFDFAVERLFRKTKHWKQLPNDNNNNNNNEPSANSYTVTLWDLTTWKEVDVVVDERLPIRPSKKANAYPELLGARPSSDGKLWVPYLEKAIAIHCGGYDKLVGGNCTNAWPMLTGSRNQYVIQKNPKTKLYSCSARFDSRTEEWSPHTNSPHDSNQSLWTVPWPKVGGGGDASTELSKEQLFDRIVAWDETNYLIGAGTDGNSDREATHGIVDNHAYSVIDSKHDVGGTGMDLLLVRNPWGHGGGLTNGLFMTGGPGWKKYPSVGYELAPIPEDTGLFWLTKDEFFRYFPTIYLCKFNTSRLKEKDYVNDLGDEFVRGNKHNKTKTKKKARPKAVRQELPPLEPWFVNKQSDPNSPYRIVEQTFNGSVSYVEMNKSSVKGKSIPEAVEEFRSNPEKYLAIHFQTSVVDEGWPVDVHQYTFIYREGTQGIQVEVTPDGKRTILTNEPRE